MKELEPLIQREEQKEKKYKKLEKIKKYLKIYEKKFHFLLLILLLIANLDLLFYHKSFIFNEKHITESQNSYKDTEKIRSL